MTIEVEEDIRLLKNARFQLKLAAVASLIPLLIFALACSSDDNSKPSSNSVAPTSPVSTFVSSLGTSSPPPDPLFVETTPGAELSEAQKAEALRIFEDTPGVSHSIAVADRDMLGVGIWSDQNGTTIRGAFIFIRLTTPQSIEGDWPIGHRAPDGTDIEASEHRIVCDLKDVNVFVDLHTKKVVRIDPVLFDYPTAKPCKGTGTVP